MEFGVQRCVCQNHSFLLLLLLLASHLISSRCQLTHVFDDDVTVNAYTQQRTQLDIDALHPQTKVVLDGGRFKASVRKNGNFTL